MTCSLGSGIFSLSFLQKLSLISIAVRVAVGFMRSSSARVTTPFPGPNSTMWSATVKSIESAILFATLLLLGRREAICLGCLKNCATCDIPRFLGMLYLILFSACVVTN